MDGSGACRLLACGRQGRARVLGWGLLLAILRSYIGIVAVIVCRPLFDMKALAVPLVFILQAWFLQAVPLLICSLLMFSCTGLLRCGVQVTVLLQA